MYKTREEVKANVEKAKTINDWKKREHNLNTIARRVDKSLGEKPMFYIPVNKF